MTMEKTLETAVLLGPTRGLVGIITEPPPGVVKRQEGVLLLDAGTIHRVGPGRLYVRLARELAAAGFIVVRFDYSGIGDSGQRSDHLPILEVAVREPQEVMDDLHRRYGLSRFVLMGICSGAYSAFKTAGRDPRVVGAALINPQDFIGDPTWLHYVQARRYFSNSLYRPSAWLNLLTGRVDYRTLITALSNRAWQFLRGRGQQAQQQARSIASEMCTITIRGAQVLLLVSERDKSIEFVDAMLNITARDLPATGPLASVLVPDADHLFTRHVDQLAVQRAIYRWITASFHLPPAVNEIAEDERETVTF